MEELIAIAALLGCQQSGINDAIVALKSSVNDYSEVVKKQANTIALHEVELAIANGKIPAEQKEFACQLRIQSKELYDLFLATSQPKKTQVPTEPMKVPNNSEPDSSYNSYSELLANPADFLAMCETNPELVEKLKNKMLNGGK